MNEPTKVSNETIATNSTPIKVPSENFKEIGTRGEFLVSSYNSEEWRVDDLTIRDYRRMKDNDGQVQMILNAIYGTLLSAGVEFVDDEDYDNESDPLKNPDSVNSPELDFVKQNLMSPKWKKGMSRDFLVTTKTNLRALEEGYRLSEIIYRVDDDGKIRLDRLAPRGIRLTDYEIKLITDDHGNYYGFHQITYFRSGVVDVIVINDNEISKSINVVFGEEYGSNYGRPILKSVWYHYDKAHKGMHLNHIGHEYGVSKFKKIGRLTNTSQAEDDALMFYIQRMENNPAIMYDSLKYDIQLEPIADAAVMQVGLDMIKYHTQQMSKALLAQFIDLGTGITKTGSRSLGKSGEEFFKAALNYIGETLIENPWNQIIADLIKINFNRGIYPTIKVKEISEEDVQLIYDSFIELTKSGKLSEEVVEQLQQKVADRLNLDITEEELEESMPIEEDKSESDSTDKDEMEDIKTDLSDTTTPRELFLDEQKVKFVTIKQKTDAAEQQAQLILAGKLQTQKDEVIASFLKAIRSGNISTVKNTKINLSDDYSYSDELNYLAEQMLEFGKRTAAEELNKNVPITKPKDKNKLLSGLGLILSEQLNRLLLRLQLVSINAINNKIPENEANAQLSQEYDSFFNTVLTPTIQSTLPDAFNQGRQITFTKYASDIQAFRYTSVLESTTCDYCRNLDGRIFQDTDPNYAMLTAPNHFGCKCFWVAITPDEFNAQDLTVNGKPSDLPVYSSISSFKGVNNAETKIPQLELSEEAKELERLMGIIDQIEIKKIEKKKQEASEETTELLSAIV